MGKYFSDVVDQALEDIYYCYDNDRAARAQEALFQASKTGDGDASYILSRCFSGPLYSWDYHPFQEHDDTVTALIRQSILQGSAMGVLGAMRVGELTPELEEAMPFDSLQQAWNAVYEKADAGCLFCQNMIGNTYYWLDIPRIENKGPGDFPTKEDFGAYLRESTLKCIPWFERAFRGGMGFSGRNLYKLYNEGEEGWLAPQPEKALEVARLGAELGYPDWQERYAGKIVDDENRRLEALSLFEKAVAQGQLYSWVYLGWMYQFGKGVPKDLPKALECYEAGTADPTSVEASVRAGRMHFNGDGVPQDYARAVQLFERAHEKGNFSCNDMLG
ncbi:MAG: sel1 repeat family protein, partial [Lawsonibacter sp.]|nr:sel1 repeat family protein [Lawsonibacter sp.]